MIRWSAACLLYLLVLSGTFAWQLQKELATLYFAGSSAEVFIDIPRGSSPGAIADMLMSAGVLRRKLPVMIYLRWTGYARRLQAGEYRFSGPARPRELIGRLVRGDVYYVAVTVPEGLTADETVELIAKLGLANLEALRRSLQRTDFIRDLDPAATALEGYLFPETYRFARKAHSDSIISAMTQQFRITMRKLLEEHALPADRTLREIVILASIIEKEARVDEERELVASVLANRLQRRMPLACDPTIIYALKLAGRYDGNIRKPDLEIDSPYNTYIRRGLPPGPVANPGVSSLRAALAPKPTPYLYFVSRNDGTHHFSADFRAHAEAVSRYQKKQVR